MAGSGADLDVACDDLGVATITIDRAPDNHFDPPLLEGIAAALERLGAGSDARVVVLQSEGRHFCAGARLAGGRPDPAAIYAPAARIFGAPLPIVAAVQGAAIGGGLGLALAADFRVAAPEARLAANFARLGFHQGFGLSVTLPAVVGPQRAAELLLTGRRVGGEEAHALGLVDRLAPLAELRASARELALEIARSAPLAVRAIRATLRRERVEAFVAALEREAAEQALLFETEDYAEGVRATGERRVPVFHGR
jgi:enoyl-CoA hydratase/carnithine racemase